MKNPLQTILLKFLIGEPVPGDKKSRVDQWLADCNDEEADLFLSVHWDLSGETGHPENVENLLDSTHAAIRGHKARSGIRKLRRWMAAAAMLILLAGIPAVLLLSRKENMPLLSKRIEYTTLRGEKSFVLLPDDTKVWLNADSKIIYPEKFKSARRKIKLNGEAYLEVRHDPEKPFFVEVSRATIKVTGTRFNIMAYSGDNNIKATLVDGEIAMITGIRSPGRKNIHILKPSHQASYAKDKKEVTLTIVDPELYTSWRYGQLTFNDESFEQVVKKLERWYDVDIHIRDKELFELNYTGKIRSESLEEVLELIRITTPIHYVYQNDNVIISKSIKENEDQLVN